MNRIMDAAQPQTPATQHAATLELLAGALCLDFANTVAPRGITSDNKQPHEYLNSYSDLVIWSRHAGALSAEAAEQLDLRAALRPAAANTALVEALELREAIYRAFESIATQQQPAGADLDAIGTSYAQAMDHVLLKADGRRFTVLWGGDAGDLERPLWPIARSAVELLQSLEPARMKVCPTPGGCGRLFYDSSKNNSRRWCSMRNCGNPEKERRRAERKRAT